RDRPQNRSGRGYPRTSPTPGWNRSSVACAISWAPPFSIAPFLISRHGPRGYRVPLPCGKLNDHAEQVASGGCLSHNVVYRVFSFRSRAQHQRRAKADLLDLLRLDAMLRDVINPLVGP